VGFYAFTEPSYLATLAPSGDTTGATDLAKLNAALAEPGPTTMQPGSWYVNGSLAFPTGTLLQAAGDDATVINQVSTTLDTFSATDQRYITIRDVQLAGPGSGTGRGIGFLFSASALAGISLENVFVQNFGGDNVHIETPITSVLTNVRSQSSGGHDFFLNNGTSVALTACYANAVTGAGNGFEFDAMTYMQLDACASDSITAANAYHFDGCGSVVATGCGAENPLNGYKIDGGSANIVLLGDKVLGETGIGYWVTGNSAFCFLMGCREASPGAGATASFQVDAGSTAFVIDPQNTTGTNYSPGTVNLFQSTNLEAHSAGSTVARISRGAVTNTADYQVLTANSGRWAFGFNPAADSTDDLYVSDIGHATTLLHAVYQATAPNLGLLGKPASYQGGVGVVALANAGTAPAGTPAGGGILYASGGHLFWLGASGTAVELA
jgi:hypothetical protein